MGLFDKLKHAVTGGAAKVVLVKHNGILAPGEMVYVKVEVTAHQDLESEGVFIDLHGEDDLDENVLEKAAELFNPDPAFSYPILAKFHLKGGSHKVVENALMLPKELVAEGRTWLLRARVEAPGKDPVSDWVKF